MADKKLYQSASRNETYQTCTALYGAKYHWRLPDPSNDGAKRGSVVHEVLELLIKPRHRKHYDCLVHTQSCKDVSAIWRFILRLARKYGVADAANLKQIDAFIMTAVMNELHGPKGTVELIGEQEFRIEVDEDGKRYFITGFIDKTARVIDVSGSWIDCCDYKSSKDFFRGEKATFNTQNLIYLLALKRMYPDIKRRRFRFLFLKPGLGWQEMEPLTDEQLEGYEYVLSSMQEQLEAFSDKNMMDNMLPHHSPDMVPQRCGSEGLKKDGTPRFCCMARKPLDYWVAVKDGVILRGAYTKGELAIKDGEKAEERHWPGCPAWYGKNGQRIQSQ